MKDTCEKLNEAKYFLCQMESNLENPDRFRWNLSAFISAARSTTMVMGVEMAHAPDFSDYLPAKIQEANTRTNGLMKYFHEQRRLTVHIRPIRPSRFISVELNLTLDLNVNAPVVFTGTGGTLSTTKAEAEQALEQMIKIEKISKDEVVTRQYFFDDIKDRDIVTLSRQYYSEVEKIVRDFRDRV
jgi:hypothetical protein